MPLDSAEHFRAIRRTLAEFTSEFTHVAHDWLQALRMSIL